MSNWGFLHECGAESRPIELETPPAVFIPALADQYGLPINIARFYPILRSYDQLHFRMQLLKYEKYNKALLDSCDNVFL